MLEKAKHSQQFWKESGKLTTLDVFQGQGEELSSSLESEDSRKENVKQEQLPARALVSPEDN